MSLFNLASDSIYRNCLDPESGDCPYAVCLKHSVIKCVLDGDKVVDESTGCVPDVAKAEYFRCLLFSNYYPSGVAHVPKPKFNNLVFCTGEKSLYLGGRRYLVDGEVSINKGELGIELRKIDLETMADR